MVDRVFWDRDPAPAAGTEVALLRVMNLGDWEAIRAIERETPRDRLEAALRAAPAGALSPRSRRFWQVRLGATDLPPPRRLPDLEHHELPFGSSP